MFAPMVKATSFDFIAAFYLYFYVGVLLRRYEGLVARYLKNEYLLMALLGVGVIPIVCEIPWYLKNVCRMVLVYDIWVIFQNYSHFFDSDHLFAKGLRLVGRNTLEIYLLHYFFLFRIYGVDKWLVTWSHDYCFRGHSCAFLMELVVLCPIAIGIAMVCIFVKNMLQPFALVKRICLGNN